MKAFFWIFWLGLIGLYSLAYLNARYDVSLVMTEWHLADKSSTIEAKSDHINKFVDKVGSLGLKGSNAALFFPTENTGFDANFAALQTLQSRLEEIKTMDPKSFEYQSAIQQITAQEQGEASQMLETIEACYLREKSLLYHPLVVMASIVAICLLMFFSSLFIFNYNTL